jgi:hypothetical protein
MVYNSCRQATILATRRKIGSGQGAILQFLPCDDPSLLISAVLERYPASFRLYTVFDLKVGVRCGRFPKLQQLRRRVFLEV